VEAKLDDSLDHAGIRIALTARQFAFLAAWCAAVLLLYVAGALAGTGLLGQYKAETEQIRKARLASPTLELTVPAPGQEALELARPADIAVGVSVRRVGELAPQESAWTGDFILWFRGPLDRVNPGEHFRIVDGEIQQQDKVVSATSSPQRYAEYHVVARMTHEFDGLRYPLADEALLIEVADITHPSQALRFVAGEKDSYVGQQAMPPNVRLIESMATARLLEYRSEGTIKAHSQFVFAMLVAPNGVGLYLKLFQALFACVAVALIALYVKSEHLDARFGLPVGAFFASISTVVGIAPLLPPANRLALADMVNLAGMATIFLVMVQSVISLYIWDTMGRERLSRLFDRLSFALMLIGYVAINLALPLAARSA
jgi:hypothetical protein